MNYVNGEYTIFIDSDDKISIHLVDKCVNIIHNFTDISMVFFLITYTLMTKLLRTPIMKVSIVELIVRKIWWIIY